MKFLVADLRKLLVKILAELLTCCPTLSNSCWLAVRVWINDLIDWEQTVSKFRWIFMCGRFWMFSYWFWCYFLVKKSVLCYPPPFPTPPFLFCFPTLSISTFITTFCFPLHHKYGLFRLWRNLIWEIQSDLRIGIWVTLISSKLSHSSIQLKTYQFSAHPTCPSHLRRTTAHHRMIAAYHQSHPEASAFCMYHHYSHFIRIVQNFAPTPTPQSTQNLNISLFLNYSSWLDVVQIIGFHYW